ncbi:MAG TPA: hypothetical protein VF591_04115 [Pyrinomonadaceae bacterium]|jgi:hypothetical protein
MMKATLSVIGIALAASLLFATTGAQEAGTPSTSAAAAVGSRATLSERVRGLLAAAGVEVGAPAAGTPAASARSHRELKVSWEADKASLPRAAAVQDRNAPGRVALLRAATRREGALPRQRSAELSPTQVVVVALDAGGHMRWCGLVADPRLLRAEAPGPDGELTGQVLYRESAEFVVQYPDDPAVAEVRLYHPDWDGQKFSLELIGAVDAR